MRRLLASPAVALALTAAFFACGAAGACSSPVRPTTVTLLGAGGSANDGAGTGGVNFGAAPQDPQHPLDADCENATPTQDADHDGWSIAQGDCDDCDWRINPGAIDVPGSAVDNDCDGAMDAGPVSPCDGVASFDDPDPAQAVRAIDLCKFLQPGDRTWGVLAASYVRADGTAFTPGLQVGLQSGFGPNVKPRMGAQVLVLSSGNARLPEQAGACGQDSCRHNIGGPAPTGFPQDDGCGGAKVINDDVALEVQLRSPTNATGYAFDSFFYTFEYPEWVCTSYNDQFVALVSPAPAGSFNGNIAFDAMMRAVSVNVAFFDVCNPDEQPTGVPPFKCALGPSMMIGTGFGDPPGGWNSAGGTGWLTTKAPVFGGDELTIRFTIWDTGDQLFDSSVLIDNFQWIADAAAPSIGTSPIK